MTAGYVAEAARSVPVAKAQLVHYVGGDVDEAAAVWGEATPVHDPVTDQEWIALIDRAARRKRGRE